MSMRDKKLICTSYDCIHNGYPDHPGCDYDGPISIGYDSSREDCDVLRCKGRLTYSGATCSQYEDEEGRR
jgi:hypothetical protein